MGFEKKIIVFLQSGSSEGWTRFFKVISSLGSLIGFLIAFVILFSVFKRKYAITFGISYGFAVIFNRLLKLIISRDRPFITYSDIQQLSGASGSSMPSGHAVSSVVIAVFLGFAFLKMSKTKFVKISSIISLIIYVGFVFVSRMYLGVHYISDVILGGIIALVISFAGIYVYKKFFSKKEEKSD